MNVDVICLSHLRWNFVFQRPNHLMSRFARVGGVHFVEEPVGGNATELRVTESDGVRVVTPHVRAGVSAEETGVAQRALLDRYLSEEGIEDYALWFYTPMALAFTRHLAPRAVVYDCMDELSGFHGASPLLHEHEAELFRRADVVFTGGQSLYEAKRLQHPNVHAFPSSVDTEHFRHARVRGVDPEDQAAIGRPRVGFFGVIDERLDLDLVEGVARLRRDLEFVLVGPVAKIDPGRLPRGPNLHYLGFRPYAALPRYIAGWDVAMMPFARNAATRFISPTKTLEYMAAGKPIVSTAIRDVVRPYGEQGLLQIADAPASFGAAIDAALREDAAPRIGAFDAYLAGTSWDRTWSRMKALLDGAMGARATSEARRRVRAEAG
jgi:glycosyltransferase involved in cell wall biosynthesis